jgi:hypothetical protein
MSLCIDDRLVCRLEWDCIQALRLSTGRTDHRGSRGITLPSYDHGTRREWGVSITPRPLFTPQKDPVPIVQETGWAPGPVWTGAENLTTTGIRSLGRPARSHSLYRIRYAPHTYFSKKLQRGAQWLVSIRGGFLCRSQLTAEGVRIVSSYCKSKGLWNICLIRRCYIKF